MEENFITEGMMEMFLYESGQMLEQLETIALECEKEKTLSESSVNEIFRIMHTIKGSSGIMMYTDITKCSHSLEDVFYYIRESKPTDVPIDKLVAIILDADDFIKNELEKIKNGQAADGSSEELVSKMNTFLDLLKNKITASGAELPPENLYSEPEKYYISPVMNPNSKFYIINIYYRSDTEMANIRAYTAVYSLKEVAEDIRYEPEDIITNESSADLILQNGFTIALQTQITEDEIMRMIDHCAGVSNIDITVCTAEEFSGACTGTQTEVQTETKTDQSIMIDLEGDLPEPGRKKKKQSTSERPSKMEDKPTDKEEASSPNAEKDAEDEKSKNIETSDKAEQKKAVPQIKESTAEKALQSKQTFISVNVNKMDELMDLIGELVIAEAVVVQNPDLKAPGLDLTNFSKASAQLSKITSELQDIVMAMRMMPLNNTFQKMNRIVYDVSRKLGKEIDLEIVGENTEVDKNIIEHISDPIMHLVRNSVDHGIETVEERALTNKPRRGKIVLEAKNEGGKVWISVKDDGHGLSREKILAKARANGLLIGKNEKDLSDKEVFSFITLPGFSTKEQVTEYSGRGVGMDVVVQNIQKIGGSLEIDSREGFGSTMIIKIPLTLAIIDGIIVGVGDNSYVIGTGDVREFVRMKQSQLIVEPEGTESMMLRGQCYPVIRLKNLFRLNGGRENVEDGVMTIIEHEGKCTAVFVDRLIGEQEIVVKPVPPYIKKTRGISGCTQLGDGSISLIIDTGSLMKDEGGKR